MLKIPAPLFRQPVTWLLAFCLFSAGCATTRSVITEMESGNKNITVDNILKIKKGESTMKDIQALFGEPETITNNETTGTKSWLYIYSLTKQNSLERAPFQIDENQLEIIFNPKDIVIEYIQTVSHRMRKD